MNTNPYDVLGISPNSSEDEIKKKYRALVKQYHPDLHPNDEEAARRMSEINAAYELIKSGNVPAQNYTSASGTSAPNGSFTRGGTTYYYQYGDPEELFRAFFGSYGFSRYSTRNTDTDPYSCIDEFVHIGYFTQAAAVLNKIDIHDAKWNYYAAVISQGMNRFADAVRFADEAVRMEPYNDSYRQLANQLNSYYVKSFRRRRSFRPLSAFTTFLAIMLGLQILRPIFYLMLLN